MKRGCGAELWNMLGEETTKLETSYSTFSSTSISNVIMSLQLAPSCFGEDDVEEISLWDCVSLAAASGVKRSTEDHSSCGSTFTGVQLSPLPLPLLAS